MFMTIYWTVLGIIALFGVASWLDKLNKEYCERHPLPWTQEQYAAAAREYRKLLDKALAQMAEDDKKRTSGRL